MEQQLPTAVASAPTLAAAEPAALRSAAMCASQNRQQLLKLAIQRQQQQEERQQQQPNQQQPQEPRPASHLATSLKQHGQKPFGHREQQRHYAEQQHQQEVQHDHEHQLLKYVHQRDNGATMHESSCTTLGSGSVSTANSGSESGSPSASDDDDEEKESQKRDSRRRALRELAHNGDGSVEIPDLPETQQDARKILEGIYKQQLLSDPQQQEQQFVEYSQQRQWQQQQQQNRSLQPQIYQQFELRQSRLQAPRSPFEEQGAQEGSLLQQQEEQGKQQNAWQLFQRQSVQEYPPPQQQQQPVQQQRLRSCAEAVAAGKRLTPYTEEVDLGINVEGAILHGLQPQTVAVHSSALPHFPPQFSITADVASSGPGSYHVTCGTGHVGWPVRPARIKKGPSTLPPCPTPSSSPFIAAEKGRVRNGAGRLYRNSRITEVKSFAGTLEDYLVFRRQQAEREEAAAAAERNRNNFSRVVAAAAADHDVPGRKAADTLSTGSCRAASTGQHFTENPAATRSSRSSSRATSAGKWSRQPGEIAVKDFDPAKGKTADLQSRWKEHLQQLFAWRRNAGVKEQTRKTTSEELRHLSRQGSRDSQQDRGRKCTAVSLNSVAEERGTLPVLYSSGAVKKDNLQFQEQALGGLNSCPRFVEEELEEEPADEDGAGMTVLNGTSWPRTHPQTEPRQKRPDGNCGLIRRDGHTSNSAGSFDARAQQAELDGSLAENQERQALAARKEDGNNAERSNAGKNVSKSKERKFIPLEIRNGEIVWPTDRPVIPLDAWIFQNFNADEPLDPQSWVHLPNVGTAVSPPAIPIPPAEQQNKRFLARPPLPHGTASLVHRLSAEAPLTGPVKLPPLKLPVGYEFDPFTIYAQARPDASTLPNIPADTAPPKLSAPEERRRSRSLTGRLGVTPPEKLKSAYTQFIKQSYVRHRPSDFEGLVVRAEEAGRILLVRSKEGLLRKLRRDECEPIGFTCASTGAPKHLLTDAARQHASRLLTATVGSVSRLGRSTSSASGRSATPSATHGPVGRGNAFFPPSAASSADKAPLQLRAESLRQKPEGTTQTQQHSLTEHASLRAAAPRSSSLPAHRSRAPGAFLNFLGLPREPPAASRPRAQRGERICNSAEKLQTQQLQLQQVPDVQEVLTLARHHANATMQNTVALNNMATIPSIRAVDSQVTVEAIRVKKYMLEGKEEENLIPVFSGRALEDDIKAASAAATAPSPAASHRKDDIIHDAKRLLLQKHEAREELKKREKELMSKEIIYAQDAPEATRAAGIAPPTIVKDTLVIPPKEEEPFHHIWQAPGIVPPVDQCKCACGKTVDTPSLPEETAWLHKV